MNQPEFEDIKILLRGFARLYFEIDYYHPECDEYRSLRKQMNRIAHQVFARLPQIPSECVLVPAVGETYAIAFSNDWEAYPANERDLAIDVFRCVSLRSVCRPVGVVA